MDLDWCYFWILFVQSKVCCPISLNTHFCRLNLTCFWLALISALWTLAACFSSVWPEMMISSTMTEKPSKASPMQCWNLSYMEINPKGPHLTLYWLCGVLKGVSLDDSLFSWRDQYPWQASSFVNAPVCFKTASSNVGIGWWGIWWPCSNCVDWCIFGDFYLAFQLSL